jgi:endonuclease-3
MAKESKEALKARARKVFERLRQEYPDARCALAFSTPFELLVATILSAQCTDVKVNQVTADLFREARTPRAFAEMPLEALQAKVRPTGFFRNKARSIQAMSTMLLEKFGGRVPRDIEDLVTLPGVARKTANVVREAAFGLPGIITDTHVIRLSGRLALTRQKDPVKIERDLQALVSEKDWGRFSHAIVFHGRRVCEAKKPRCDACGVSDLCPSAFRFPHFRGKAAR